MLSLSGAITERNTKTTTVHPSQKERFFDLVVLGWNAKRTLVFDKRQPLKSDEPKKKDSSKNKTTQKHIHRERYDEKSSIDIPDDAFFKRRTTEDKEDEFDESVHELFFQGVKKDDDDD